MRIFEENEIKFYRFYRDRHPLLDRRPEKKISFYHYHNNNESI